MISCHFFLLYVMIFINYLIIFFFFNTAEYNVQGSFEKKMLHNYSLFSSILFELKQKSNEFGYPRNFFFSQS